jgi:16S rRNA (cytosine1402-N4)-methyltransferase
MYRFAYILAHRCESAYINGTMSRPVPAHVSVLLNEVIEGLNPQPSQIFVDGTLGGGGHTRVLAERVGASGLVIGLDRDPAALEAAQQHLAGLPVKLVNANFCDLPEVLAGLQIPTIDGVLLDLGLSSDQLADVTRGFSFDADGPLDMRFNPAQGEPAWRLLNRLSAEHLADMIYHYGEERYSRRIGRKIVEQRRKHPIQSAHDLAELVRSCVPRSKDSERIDPATRTFQALRIAVNDELKSLEIALRRIPDCVKPGGRIAIISFHSLEDRRVKEAFRDDPRYQSLTKKPIVAGPGELMRNPRARSAKLRIAQRNDV